MIIHLLAVHLVIYHSAILPPWFWHPLGACNAAGSHSQVIACKSYNWWSGIVGDIALITLLTGTLGILYAHLKRHNCHVRHCPRLQWKATAAGDIVCKHHHPNDPKTAQQVLDDHHTAGT